MLKKIRIIFFSIATLIAGISAILVGGEAGQQITYAQSTAYPEGHPLAPSQGYPEGYPEAPPQTQVPPESPQAPPQTQVPP